MPATAVIVRRTLPDAAAAVVVKVLGDRRSDQRFAEKVRFYYGQGRAEVPPERPAWLIGPIGDSRPRKGAPAIVQTPLWRDLQHKTTYRVFGALIFDELCHDTGINAEELQRRLREELRRSMSRQTLAAWRRGDQSVPTDVLFAAGAIAHRTLTEVSRVVAMRVLIDPKADPRLAEMLRLFLVSAQHGS
jgi:hypothetical protein